MSTCRTLLPLSRAEQQSDRTTSSGVCVRSLHREPARRSRCWGAPAGVGLPRGILCRWPRCRRLRLLGAGEGARDPARATARCGHDRGRCAGIRRARVRRLRSYRLCRLTSQATSRHRAATAARGAAGRSADGSMTRSAGSSGGASHSERLTGRQLARVPHPSGAAASASRMLLLDVRWARRDAGRQPA